MRRVFNSILGFWRCGQTQSIVFDVVLVIYLFVVGLFIVFLFRFNQSLFMSKHAKDLRVNIQFNI